MIAGEDDQRIIEETAILEELPETTEERIGVGDFAVIRSPGVLRKVGFGRCVGIVRVIEMEPDEERCLAIALVEPRLGGGDGFRSPTAGPH